MSGKVLILGGNGRFGRNVAEAFWNAGWTVRLFRRGDDLTAAALGQDIIVHGWNPKYTDWARDVPRQTEEVIAAAKASGARVILGGNVYVFGKDAPPDFGPHVPHAASNGMGRIRVEMERRLRESGIRFTVLRAGDFLDTEASGNWFDTVMAKRAHKGVFTYPGAPDIPRAWAYLPDVARAVVGLAEASDDLPRVADIAFPGFTLTGRDLAGLCTEALDRDVRLKPVAWWLLRVTSPFWPQGRRLLEMRYLWDKPHWLTRDSFDAVLPGFIETPAAEAVAQALAPLGKRPPRPGDVCRAPRTGSSETTPLPQS